MLTRRDLILMRAALHYFDDEIAPYVPEGAAPYWDEPLEEGPTPDEIRSLRQRLVGAELSYLACDSSGVLAERDAVSLLSEVEARQRGLDLQALASVLLPLPESR